MKVYSSIETRQHVGIQVVQIFDIDKEPSGYNSNMSKYLHWFLEIRVLTTEWITKLVPV